MRSKNKMRNSVRSIKCDLITGRFDCLDGFGRAAVVQAHSSVPARRGQQIRMSRVPRELIHQIRVILKSALFDLQNKSSLT
jgi:hypothetical protein